ncbi:MAG: trypsin-like peptidase domain-containing protein [Thermoleophilia bacterium]|nr:trypsin-like peptidase domain-containing protein [Thermoleophilia bacterium]
MTLAVVALTVAVGLGMSGCTFEFGSQPDTTLSPASTLTTVAGPGATTETTTATNTTRSTVGQGSVVASGDGVGSPAQKAATILAPSVVNITVAGTVTVSQGPWQQEYEYASEGSGVIYHSDGMIITNNHVVTDAVGDLADEIMVTLTTGEKLPATVVGNDPLTDLAVIKVNPDFDLPVATFVTEPPEIGEYAVAIGSPLGYENSVSLGIVSGLDRSIDKAQGSEGIALNNLVQTDAPISPGNSGGALANASGQVIGINVAYEPPTTGAVSIGFAIPSVLVVKVADEIISTGKATHAYIGVGTLTIDSALQQQFNLSRSSGILVRSVTDNGPAGKAGILQGDIILEVDGEEMAESSDLLVAIRDRKPGDVVEVIIDRDGREMTFSVTLEERPADLF